MSMNPPLAELPPKVIPQKYNLEDLTGKRFGRLTCVYYVGHCKWLCKCDCGDNVFKVVAKVALRHAIKSCGCLAREQSADRARIQSTKHGLHRSSEYTIWQAMLQRCQNPNNPGWRLYGERGVRVCKEWKEFSRFYKDMGPRPSPKHQLDRRDNGLLYSKQTCRWATTVEQANNTRRNHRLVFGGRNQTIAEWAREIGVNYGTLTGRIQTGWTAERALTTSVAHKTNNK